MIVCLDASVVVPTLVRETSSAAVDAYLGERDRRAVAVSDFAALETASAISRLVRMGELTPISGQARLLAFDAWRATGAETVELLGEDVRRAGQFVRRFDLALRGPDALHIAICMRLDAGLLTLDRGLRAAAEALGIAAPAIS